MSSRVSRMIGKSIAGRYRILGEIGVGGMGRVFRAMPFDDPSMDVAIKVILRDRQINSEDLLRFQKEAAVMSRLHHPNIICFHELGLLDPEQNGQADFGHGYYIVMEIANGSNLKKELEQEGRKDLNYFFQLAISIADALDYTHGKNIIHRDIKPQNIMVGRDLHNSKSLVVKVLDFGVARLAEQTTAVLAEPGRNVVDFAGTPMYMAPEQSTLMTAEVDHRVDLYSLGCVLYEVLTGRPPFSANSREKLERQHVTSTPEPLTSLRPDVPPIVEAIVHKLLAKHPDDRYKSAFSLRSDLLRAKRRLDRKERPSAVQFPLAANDRVVAVSANLTLVGRDAEFAILRNSYDVIANEKGRSRLSVVKGEAGCGKTRLLAEFRQFLAKRRIRFISTTFSQHENNLPFNALANGFNDYLIRLLRTQPIEAEEVKRKVKTLLGPIAHQVAAVVPGLKPYIDAEQSLEDALQIKQDEEPDKENFSTFLKAFSDFTRCLAVDNQPVVFIFDDLHWADSKSLDLIDQFFSHNNSQRFLLAVSYRTSDSRNSLRLNEFLEKFAKLKRRYEEIVLSPLDTASIELMARNIVQSPTAMLPDFVRYLQALTGGNPTYLVDVVRILVSQDLVKLVDGVWAYDVAQIESAQPRFNTVDLVLNRLLTYDGSDSFALQIAAVVGMSFQFELLMADPELDSKQVLRVLDNGVEEGFIARGVDDEEFIHLGKTYNFTHWRARDQLYQKIPIERRRKLHRYVAARLQEQSDSRSPKVVFAIAHHLNSALNQEKAEDLSLAIRCIDMNIEAGREAMRTNSWQSAQRYFENAYGQMKYWPDAEQSHSRKSYVIEHLGDLAALQRRHGDAIRFYDYLSKSRLDLETRAALAYKRLKLQLIAGVVSASVRLVRRSLREQGLAVPDGKFMDQCYYIYDLCVDLCSRFSRRHRLVRLLSSAHQTAKKKKRAERKNYAGKIYEMGQLAYLQYRPERAWYYHQYVLRMALARKVAPSTAIKVVAERAIILARFGRRKLSYALLDAAMECARSLQMKNLYGYICLIRAIYIDYKRDRDDEVKVNLRAAMRYISPEEERIWYAQCMQFAMFREMLKGRNNDVLEFAHSIPDYVQTRSWISPRTMSMLFYTLLLCDTRDQIVARAEYYLQRRDQVSGRANDLFILICQTILSFVKGEADKTEKYYREAVYQYTNGYRDIFLFPFEEDFVGLFALTFPSLFAQEYRRKIMEDKDLYECYRKLNQHFGRQWSRSDNRGAALLLRARCHELLGLSKVKALYDEALRTAKIADHHLLLTLGHVWFGNYLLKHGAKFRNEYLRRAHASAQRYGYQALVEYTEKVMEQRDVDFRKSELEPQGVKVRDRSGQYRSKLAFEHAQHVAAIMPLDTSLEAHLEESLAILGRYYLSGRVIVLSAVDGNRQCRVLYPYESNFDETNVLNYLQPYLNIRSTLFLPLQDAPWFKSSASFAEQHSDLQLGTLTNARTDTLQHSEDQPAQLDRTLQIQDAVTPMKTQNLDRTIGNSTDNQDATSKDTRDKVEPQRLVARRSLAMSALIPLRYNDNTMGVIYLEDVDLSNKETVRCRTELDVFGAQLGLVLSRKTFGVFTSREVKRTSLPQALDYQPAAHYIEPVQWMRIWSHGRMRAGRESGWYLGLNMSDRYYMLAYCRVNGPQVLREKISALLWYQLQCVKTIASINSRNELDMRELREEVQAQLLAVQGVSELESLSIALTLFDRQTKQALSGHFGPSRPLVLCQTNQITPENRIVMTLGNGRDVRYWDVQASMVGPHVYILAHDSSRFDITPSETQRRLVFTHLSQTRDPGGLHGMVESLIIRDNMPRYYVGGVLIDETEQKQLNSQQSSVLPKAQ